MSLLTRKELLKHVQKRYKNASWLDKVNILDEFISSTSYNRKYAIKLLNLVDENLDEKKREKRKYNAKYDEAIRQALLTIWHAANQICSKRLVPFIPDLLPALERFGHISLPEDVRSKLLTISPATVDRLLETERREGKKGLCTTRSGSLLKNQIKIRTFADWNDVIPGFLEGDLVAHCGDRANGAFLNTLVITDIASGWTEFFPILRKCEVSVIAALKVAQQILPFVLLGLDTDNGSEFINYALLEFCKENKITFTRSRAYKKNDQAHVEEKNGSIVRRLIGYDRYEGLNAHNALSELYATLRLYVNFFQPSLKLLSKKRDGAKVTKKYDKAKTPYQRLILSPHLSEDEKEKLTKQYDTLDPLHLFKKLEALQDNFWKHAWNPKAEEHTADPNENINQVNELINFTPSEITKAVDVVIESDSEKSTCHIVTNNNLSKDSQETNTDSPSKIRRYRNTKKPRKKLEKRTWRTRKDPFENVWDRIRLQLELNPELTAKSFLENLIKENSDEFNIKQLRTLQRQVTCWRVGQLKIQQEMYSQKTLPQDPSAEYISYITASVVI